MNLQVIKKLLSVSVKHGCTHNHARTPAHAPTRVHTAIQNIYSHYSHAHKHAQAWECKHMTATRTHAHAHSYTCTRCSLLLLQSLGFHNVVLAKTGVEAIAQFRVHSPDVVLMDLMVKSKTISHPLNKRHSFLPQPQS